MAKYHFFRHLHTVDKHRLHVFLNCLRCGYPFRGLVHDLSKYSPTEFFNSAKYYQGISSPVYAQRKKEDWYSTICIHHTRRNRHHFEYWVDFFKGDIVLRKMPLSFEVEYGCDVIAASQTYQKKSFSRDMPYQYFLSHSPSYMMSKATKEFELEFFKRYSESGFKHLKRKDTKKMDEEVKKKYPDTEIIKVYGRDNFIN